MTDRSTFSEYTAHLRGFIARAANGLVAEVEFDELARQLFHLQFAYNPVYRRICLARKLAPESIQDWRDIPAVPTVAFKEMELTSLPLEQRARVFYSSGTTDSRPSRHFHDAESLALYEASLLPWFSAHLLGGQGKSLRFVMLTPPPEQAPHSSLVHMLGTIRRELAPRDSAFTGQVERDGAWSLDGEKTRAAFNEAVATRRPVILLGTAFNYVHLLDHLAETNLRLQLPPGSRVMETGGYKGRSRLMPKAELHARITEWLGVPPVGIVCEYGMSELSSQAYDSVAHGGQSWRVFRFPPWVRARIISPETGCEVSPGETGLICILDLANVRSALALQTEDLGIRRVDGFELIGRATLAEPRGCSLMATT